MAIQEFEATIIEKKDLTKDVILLSFAVPESFAFLAGQFIMLRIRNGDTYKFKSYSVLNPPSQKGRMDLCIKIIDGGFASEAFKALEAGQSMTMRGSFGQFVFHPESVAEEFWFIGTGTGVAPLYCMIKEHLKHYPQKKFRLIFGVRSKADLLFHEEFQDLEKMHANFQYWPTLSQEEWSGYNGRVQRHLGEDLHKNDFYICGLKEMVLETQQYLLDRGVDAKHIHYERYS